MNVVCHAKQIAIAAPNKRQGKNTEIRRIFDCCRTHVTHSNLHCNCKCVNQIVCAPSALCSRCDSFARSSLHLNVRIQKFINIEMFAISCDGGIFKIESEKSVSKVQTNCNLSGKTRRGLIELLKNKCRKLATGRSEKKHSKSTRRI